MSKTIKLKSLELLNFKGIADLKIEFASDTTNISGRNGSGKTTIFDAFTYVLFGKDSHDRKDFNIKTLGPDGKPLPKIPHEVKCVLDVDGEAVELQRRYCEKWTKRRGSAVEEFSGHEEERFVNGVPCSVKDYNAKVAEICGESVFKFITNPLYFNAQKTDVQRAMLFRMAGGVSDSEVASGNAAFEALLKKLTGKTLDEYKREIAAKKRRIKESVESIPARIDERRRDTPDTEDWAALEDEKADLKAQIDALDGQLSDISKLVEAEMQSRKGIMDELNRVRMAKQERDMFLHNKLLADYNKHIAEYNDTKARLRRLGDECSSIAGDITAAELGMENLKQERERLLAAYRAISAETLTFDESGFVCPTCGRKYDLAEIEARQQDMSEKFRADKAQRLEANKTKGLAIKTKIEAQERNLADLRGLYAQRQAEYQTLSESPILGQQMAKPDVSEAIRSDKEYIALTNKETDLVNQLQSEGRTYDTSSIKLQKDAVLEEISEIDGRLAKRETIQRNEKRIAELEQELKAQSQELATLEGKEFTIAQFGRARVTAIESRINAMFSVVKFKMFEQQINGGEVETCEAMVDGVPYSDLNNAGKINAGLDIINAICRYEQVYAPIFIDNAESVNALLPTASQTIRLVVTDDKTLTID